jgi:protein ImuA
MTALAEILVRPDVWRGNRLAEAPLPAVPSGFATLDAELPGGGWPRGALTELLVDSAGFGELSLLIPALRHLGDIEESSERDEAQDARSTATETYRTDRRGSEHRATQRFARTAISGWSLLVAPPYSPHAPAWANSGIDLSRLAVVSPASGRDALWAMEQALASGAPRAVVGWSPHADARAIRRLQVAAVTGGALVFLFRPARAASEASAAPLRLQLAGEGSQLSVRILKRRGPPLSMPLMLAVSRPVRHGHHRLARHTSVVRDPVCV